MNAGLARRDAAFDEKITPGWGKLPRPLHTRLDLPAQWEHDLQAAPVGVHGVQNSRGRQGIAPDHVVEARAGCGRRIARRITLGEEMTPPGRRK